MNEQETKSEAIERLRQNEGKLTLWRMPDRDQELLEEASRLNCQHWAGPSCGWRDCIPGDPIVPDDYTVYRIKADYKPAKEVKPKKPSTRSRRVIETWDGIEYSKESINGDKPSVIEDTIDNLREARGRLTSSITSNRKLLSRYKSLLKSGRLD